MLGELFEFLLPFAAVAAIGWNAYAKGKSRHRAVSDELRRLGASPQSGPSGVTGSVGGLLVRYHFRSTHKNRPPGTRCVVTLAANVPRFEMELRPQTPSELRHVERGRAIDLVLGDEAFDNAFIVEAAPAAIAHGLLDHVTRTHLLAFAPCKVSVGDGTLVFDKASTLDEPGEIQRVLEVCVGIASRLQVLKGELEEEQLAAAAANSSQGYRGPAPDALVAADAGLRESVELARLHQVRALRKTRERAVTALVIVLAVATVLIELRTCH